LSLKVVVVVEAVVMVVSVGRMGLLDSRPAFNAPREIWMAPSELTWTAKAPSHSGIKMGVVVDAEEVVDGDEDTSLDGSVKRVTFVPDFNHPRDRRDLIKLLDCFLSMRKAP
jgi:hypothetical protein